MCVYVCVYVCVHVCRTYVYACVCTCIVCMCTYVYRMCVRVSYVCVCVSASCMCVRTCIMYLCACVVCVCMCVCREGKGWEAPPPIPPKKKSHTRQPVQKSLYILKVKLHTFLEKDRTQTLKLYTSKKSAWSGRVGPILSRRGYFLPQWNKYQNSQRRFSLRRSKSDIELNVTS